MAAYQSILPEGTVVIDDDTPLPEPSDDFGYSGLIPRDYNQEPVGAVGRVMANHLRLSEDEIRARMEANERGKATLFDLCKDAGLEPLDQARTNYCWVNGVTDCAQVTYLKQTGEKVLLSPASVGGPITGYRNVGGWGAQAHEYGRKHGWVPAEVWPPNAIDRRYAGEEARESREHYKIAEWGDAPPRDMMALLSLTVQGIPCAAAYNWWRHLVTPIQPVYRDGQWGVLCRNSGLGRDRTGHTVLLGRRAIPDELTFIYAMTPPGE